MDANSVVTGLDAAITIVRYVFLGGAALVGVVCAGDWMVRTRRLSPFGAPARFFRKTVDPAIAPVERAVIRYGGVPTAAPLWALLAVIIAGVLLLSLLGVLRDDFVLLVRAAAFGARGIIAVLIDWAIGLLELAIWVRVIASWVNISPYSRWIRWSYTLTEWLVRPISRRVRPVNILGAFVDLSPFIALLMLWGIGRLAQWLIAIS